MKGTIVITGASKGIGEQAAYKFSSKGYRVIGVSRDEKMLKKVASQCSGEKMVVWADDIGTATQGKRVINRIFREYSIDGVILNAGISIGGDFKDSQQKDWQTMLNVNYLSPASTMKEAIRHFSAQGHGHILAVGSLTSLIPFPSNGAYAASKSAFYSLMRTVKAEMAKDPIQFSMVLPGLTATSMSESFKTILPRSHPRKVADALWKCWKCPQYPYIVGPFNQMTGRLNRLAPWALDFMVAHGKMLLPQYRP